MAVGPITQSRGDRPPIVAGIFLGMGFAGFFDGIVLHQVLQWHHLLTSVRPIHSIADLEANTLWDGLFHIFALILTIIGLVLLWRSRHVFGSNTTNEQFHPTTVLIGAMMVGAGGFNVVEGLVNHHLLQIHHVKLGPHQTAWDFGFLALGTVLAIAGWLIVRGQIMKNQRQPLPDR